MILPPLPNELEAAKSPRNDLIRKCPARFTVSGLRHIAWKLISNLETIINSSKEIFSKNKPILLIYFYTTAKKLL